MGLGTRLKRFRERKNITQSSLGIMLGFNPVTAAVRIAQYEANTKKPKEEIYKKLEDIFNVQREVFSDEIVEYAESFISGDMTLKEAYDSAIKRRALVYTSSWDAACVYKYDGQIDFLKYYMRCYGIKEPGDEMYINNVIDC